MSATRSPSRLRLALLERLADLVTTGQQAHPVRVAVDGVDAAGKTSLADELVGPLTDRGRSVIRGSVDGFHRPRADRYRRGELSAEGYYHDAFDYPALRANLLDPLGPGGTGRYRTATFDFRTDQPRAEPFQRAAADAVLVFDGVFLLRPELSDAWDLRIFLDVPFQETIRRALARDRALYGSTQAVEERYHHRYLPGQRHYLATVQPQRIADVVIDNHDPATPRLTIRTLDPAGSAGPAAPDPASPTP
ncbi:MAG TPA: uridine kinase [Actinomycetota bacterium]|jgi:uridine kinase|nr:uridine kinase [Actinomycetota bacterium]